MEQHPYKKRRTGNAPLTLLSCHLCESKRKLKEEDYKYESHKTFPWALSISCPDPSHYSWKVCQECQNMKTKMTNLSQLRMHHRRYHQARQVAENNTQFFRKKSTAEPTIKATKDTKNMNENFDLMFATKECNTYFQEEKKGLGKNYLVAYSHFHLKDISSRVDAEDVDLDLKMSYLLSQITHNQRALFMDIIDCVIKKERNNSTNLCPKCNLYTMTKIKKYMKLMYLELQKQ